MKSKNTFNYNFVPDPPNRIRFEYSPEEDEKLDVVMDGDVPVLSLNRSGMITVAQLLIKMAKGEYVEGFHVHLQKDFDGDSSDRLIIMLGPDDAPPYR